jgi:iron complex outermembrane recepter protein
VPLEYGSETVTSYELGVKSQFLDHRAAVDAAAFYVNHNNIQVGEVSNSLDYTGNGGKAVSKGVEFQSTFSLVQGLNFGFNATYTQSELTSISPNVTGGLLPGYQLPYVPKWALSGTVAYDWTLSNSWRAHVGAGAHWQDVVWDGVVSSISGGGGPVSQLPSYGGVDLDASLSMGKLTLKAYVRNLTNEYAFTSATITGQQTWYTTLQPRTVGVGFDVKF